MSSDADIVLSVKNVSKCFEMYEKPVHRLYQTFFAGHRKFYKEFWALRDISFDVHRGECVGIIGRNGAGKSTLLQIITGTLAPTTGEVKLKGRVAALLELGSGFNPEFTGRENVYLNGTILGLTKEEIDARYDEILAFADIGDFINQPVKTYSSGMMVRLAFAVNAFVDPDILIVDEALAVGDLFFQQKCLARLKAMIARGTTVLFVTHSMFDVEKFCSRGIYLRTGGIRMIGAAVPVCTAYLNDTTVNVSNVVIESADSNRLRQAASEGTVSGRYREDPDFQKRCAESSGSREVEYVALDFYDQSGNRIATCRTGETVTAVASLRANADIPAGAAVGFLCRDLQNTNLFALNSNSYKVWLDMVSGGCRFTVEWTFDFPLLPGKYLFSLGLKPHEDSQQYYHRVFSVAALDVLPPLKGFVNTGIVHMPKCHVSVIGSGSI